MTFLELSVSLLWKQGPEWLQLGFEPQPTFPDQTIPKECLVEKKTSQPLCLVATSESKTLDSIIDITRFSSLEKLFQITAMVFRAVRRFKKAVDQEDFFGKLSFKSAQLTLVNVK